MIDRLYDTGMLMSGEVRHYNAWEHPTMPRLRATQPIGQRRQPISPSRKRGYVALLLDVLRSK